ncbi:MAG TPA: phosphatidate cytidylyltransferase [Bacteroidia bacterium]|nr:phosphatidate cytidylyltransferase [Bacteroidia bacterium]
MNRDILHLLLIGGIFFALFLAGEFLFHIVKVKGEYTRKFIHISTGFITLLFPFFFTSHWYVLILCAGFAVILKLSLKLNMLKSINAIDRDSHGSISYPASVYGTFLFAQYAYSQGFEPALYFVPILTLALCDPAAAITGKNLPWKPFKVGEGKKTVSGTLAFFMSALALNFILVRVLTISHPGPCILMAATIAVFTTIAEAVSRKGLDNIFVPATAILLLWFFLRYTHLFISTSVA